jgi:hypothetical protein
MRRLWPTRGYCNMEKKILYIRKYLNSGAVKMD